MVEIWNEIKNTLFEQWNEIKDKNEMWIKAHEVFFGEKVKQIIKNSINLIPERIKYISEHINND